MALSAIRNLNGIEMKKRQIRVNFTTNDNPDQDPKDGNLIEEDFIGEDGQTHKKITQKTCLENYIDNLTVDEKFFLVLQ